MRSSILALAALVAGVHSYANESVYYLTTTVTALTTYCPGPTVLTHGSLTSTITEATTVTITDCPCTAVIPITVSTSVACVTCAAPTIAPISNSTASISSFRNSTISAIAGTTPTETLGSGSAASTTANVASSPSGSTVAPFTGSANMNSAVAFSGVGLAGLLGFVAYVL